MREGELLATADEGAYLMGLGDLLSGWDEEWVVDERYRTRMVVIDLVTECVQRLVAEGDLPHALSLARALAALEPNRESAHRALAQIHLADGDRAEAWRVYEAFHHRSVRDFGVGVSVTFRDLLEPVRVERQARRMGGRRPGRVSRRRSSNPPDPASDQV